MEENDIDKSTERTYSRDEVSEHNTKEDAWIIFDKDVFDISDFLDDPDQHPGIHLSLIEGIWFHYSEIFVNPIESVIIIEYFLCDIYIQ